MRALNLYGIVQGLGPIVLQFLTEFLFIIVTFSVLQILQFRKLWGFSFSGLILITCIWSLGFLVFSSFYCNGLVLLVFTVSIFICYFVLAYSSIFDIFLYFVKLLSACSMTPCLITSCSILWVIHLLCLAISFIFLHVIVVINFRCVLLPPCVQFLDDPCVCICSPALPVVFVKLCI